MRLAMSADERSYTSMSWIERLVGQNELRN